jgi:hypothetical protein
MKISKLIKYLIDYMSENGDDELLYVDVDIFRPTKEGEEEGYSIIIETKGKELHGQKVIL